MAKPFTHPLAVVATPTEIQIPHILFDPRNASAINGFPPSGPFRFATLETVKNAPKPPSIPPVTFVLFRFVVVQK
jgi:hypothetical protein